MSVLSTISHETDENGFITKERFVTENGFELTIAPTASGLWEVVPRSGGTPPTICNSAYTSRKLARDALIDYVAKTDKLGYADYPTKTTPRKKTYKERQAEVAENGAS